MNAQELGNAVKKLFASSDAKEPPKKEDPKKEPDSKKRQDGDHGEAAGADGAY